MFNYRLIPELADLEQLHNYAESQKDYERAAKLKAEMIRVARSYIEGIKTKGITIYPRGKVAKLGKSRRNRRQRNRRQTRKNIYGKSY